MASLVALNLMPSGPSVKKFCTNMLLQLPKDVMEQTICTYLLPSRLKICDKLKVVYQMMLRSHQLNGCDYSSGQVILTLLTSFTILVIESRLVLSEHPDWKYAAMLYKYLKHFTVRFRENCLMIDKATVPVEEPGKPQAAGVRSHNRSLVPVDGPVLSAMDHDFHLAGIIPSVAFILDISGDPTDSFFNGHVFVTCKDKIFEQSSPFRHGAELGRILDNHFCADGVLEQKLLLLYVTGFGKTLRMGFFSRKLSLMHG